MDFLKTTRRERRRPHGRRRADVTANTVPTISVPASGTLDPSGLTATLSVLGTDAADGSDISYTWTTASVPSGSGYSPGQVTISHPSGQTYAGTG